MQKRAVINKRMGRSASRSAHRGGWQLQEAKNQFSEVVRRAGREGAQTISLHGRPAAVVISYEDYRRLRNQRESFTKFLTSLPMARMELELERNKSADREIEL